ncbi:MAG: hypothetical protein H2057_02015 [Alphaproteobacteria bacterium]|nr:hypothetical protein [Alphaproteobacteria bacterium]
MKILTSLSLVLGLMTAPCSFSSDVLEDAQKAPVTKSGWNYLWDGAVNLKNAAINSATAVSSAAYDLGYMGMGAIKASVGVVDMVNAVTAGDDEKEAANLAFRAKQNFTDAKAHVLEGLTNVPVTMGHMYQAGMDTYSGLSNLAYASAAGISATYEGLKSLGHMVYNIYDSYRNPFGSFFKDIPTSSPEVIIL